MRYRRTYIIKISKISGRKMVIHMVMTNIQEIRVLRWNSCVYEKKRDSTLEEYSGV